MTDSGIDERDVALTSHILGVSMQRARFIRAIEAGLVSGDIIDLDRSSPAEINKSKHDVSREPRDEYGKWTKFGASLSKPSKPEAPSKEALDQKIFMQRILNKPQVGDLLYIGDKQLPTYGDAAEVSKIHYTYDNKQIFGIEAKELGQIRFMTLPDWQERIKSGQYIPRHADDIAPAILPQQWERLRTAVDSGVIQKLLEQSQYGNYTNMWYHAVNILSAIPPIGMAFHLNTAIPGVESVTPGKNWVIQDAPETPAEVGPNAKIVLKTGQKKTVTLTGEDWYRLVHSGRFPIITTQVLDSLPKYCKDCGKPLHGKKEVHQCPYCHQPFCAADIEHHKEICPNKIECAKCSKDISHNAAYTCPMCKQKFCQKHIEPNAHQCPKGTTCDSCHKIFYPQDMFTDKKTNEHFCSECTKKLYGARDVDGDGLITAFDIVNDVDIQGRVKNSVVQAISRRLANNKDFADLLAQHNEKLAEGKFHRYENELQNTVDFLIGNWANTSCDSNPTSVALQKAAAQEFTQKDYAQPWHDKGPKNESEEDDPDYIYRPDPEDEAEQLLADVGPGLRAFLRAMYDETQEYFKKKGIKQVKLYRGMYWQGRVGDGFEDYTPSKAADTYPYKQIGIGPQRAKARLQPISSFSTSPKVAMNFAGDGNGGILLRMNTLPVEKVLGTALTGFGCLGEQEMVVMGGELLPCEVEDADYEGNGWQEQDKATQYDDFWMDAAGIGNPSAKKYRHSPKQPAQKSLSPTVPLTTEQMPVLNVDADLVNADWTKQAWNLPPYGSPLFNAYLRRAHMTVAQFERLPVYWHFQQKNQKALVTPTKMPLIFARH